MKTEPIFVGIDLATSGIKVAAANGQRSSISGARREAPEEWFELVLYGLSVGPTRLAYAAVAVPVGTTSEETEAIVRGARVARFEGAFVCTAPHALARGVERRAAGVSIVVDSKASSVAVVQLGTPGPTEVDTVRPIPGREAREIAIAVRCLVKKQPREMRRTLLRNVVLAGDPSEIERIGQAALLRELEAEGASVDLVPEPYAVALGAERLATEVDSELWSRLREEPTVS